MFTYRDTKQSVKPGFPDFLPAWRATEWIQKCDSEFLANFLGGKKPAFKNIYRINEVIRTLKCYYLGNIIWEMGGQGGLAYCSPWGRKELDITGQLSNNNNSDYIMSKMLFLRDVIT